MQSHLFESFNLAFGIQSCPSMICINLGMQLWKFCPQNVMKLAVIPITGSSSVLEVICAAM